MNEQEELLALRRLAQLEAKAAGVVPGGQDKYDPTAGMSAFQRGAAGAGKAMVDVARGTGQLFGLVSRGDVEEARKRDAALMATTGGTVGNIVGNIATMAPLALVPGVNTIAGGAAAGAASGLLQPSTSGAETAINVGLGGAAGAAVPAVMRGLQSAKAVAQPFYAAGQEAILGRALRRAAGTDAPAVARRLEEAAAPFVGPSQGVPRATMGELVPGSMPNVAQASRNAGVAALQRAATAGQPQVTNAIDDLFRSQNAARVGLLQDMAGADGGRAFAAANRDATAEQLYGAARRIGIDPASVTPEAQANIARFAQRVPDAILAEAKKMAKISGSAMDDTTSVQGLHWVKMAIDDAIGAAKQSGNRRLKKAYVGLQSDLLQGMDAMSPAYAAARKVYADMSRPVNQMDVAGAIGERSIDKLTGNIQPRNFARALSDKTAAAATGMPDATLERTMSYPQQNALAGLLEDLQRAEFANTAGRGVGSDTVQKLAYTNILDEAGIPSFMREFKPAQVAGNVLGRAADAAYGRANRELAGRLAEAMLDPGQAAALMRAATPAQRNVLLEYARRGAAGLSMAAPALANGHKE